MRHLASISYAHGLSVFALITAALTNTSDANLREMGKRYLIM